MTSANLRRHDFRLVTPLTYGVFGSSMSGKSTHITKVIEARDDVFSKPIGQIYYFFKTWQSSFEMLERKHNVRFMQGMITKEWLDEEIGLPPPDGRRQVPLIIVDDAGSDLNAEQVDMTTVHVHHYELALVYLLHVLFSPSPHLRAMSHNMSYITVMKNPRNLATIHNLGRQIDPGQHNGRFVRIYKEATKRPWSFLFIDNTQFGHDDMRLRSNILFERNEPMVIYKRI